MRKSSRGPGFRFYPTNAELVMYYLKNKLLGKKIPEVIAEVNIYDFSPQDLPAMSCLKNGDLQWFFFCSKSKKYLSGSRMNRATENGYWKATGKDREVKHDGKAVAMIKTLVFHQGNPSKGKNTNWVMHEYQMEDKGLADAGVVQDAYVLCKLFKKNGSGPQNGAEYGAPFDEDEWKDVDIDGSEDSMVVNLSTEPAPSMVTSSEGVGLVGVSRTQKCDPNCSVVTNMTITKPGPSSVGVDLVGVTRTLKSDAGGSVVTKVNVTMTEPGPSTIALIDDDMLTHEDIAPILLVNSIQEVEDRKGKNVITSPKADDGMIFKDWIPLYNPNDLIPNEVNMFGIDNSADFMVDAIFADDLDDSLARSADFMPDALFADDLGDDLDDNLARFI